MTDKNYPFYYKISNENIIVSSTDGVFNNIGTEITLDSIISNKKYYTVKDDYTDMILIMNKDSLHLCNKIFNNLILLMKFKKISDKHISV